MTPTQRTIRAYVQRSGSLPLEQPLYDRTLRCFVGMIETGEATIEDFRTAAGHHVAEQVETAYKDRRFCDA